MVKPRILGGFSILLLGLFLIACSANERLRDDDISLHPLLVYQSKKIRFDLSMDVLDGGCLVNGVAYFMGIDQENSKQFSLISVNTDGITENLPNYSPIQFAEDIDVRPIFCKLHSDGEGNIWAIEQFITISDQSISDEKFFRQLNCNGEEIYRFESAELADIQDICLSKDGKILVNRDGKVSILDSNGQMLSKLDGQGVETQDFVFLGDGRIGLFNTNQAGPGETHCSLYTIDTESGVWGEAFQIPLTASCIYSGDKNALFYYLDGTTLYAWREESSTGEEILNWVNCGFDGMYVAELEFMEDGRLAVITRKDRKCEFFVLTPTVGQLDKIELTLGSINPTSNLQQTVIDFNNSSEDYYISLVDYAQGGISYNQAATRFATEIVTGNMPDLLCVDYLPIRSLEINGYLEDLWPYIDKDSQLDREKLMLRPLQAAELGGELYRISNCFFIRTVAGNKEIVGDQMSWTLADMNAALDSMPTGGTAWGRFGTKQRMLSQELYYMDRFVDWGSGTCNFESNAFKSMLVFCNSFPDTVVEDARDAFGYSAVLSGQQMLLPVIISSPQSLVEHQFLFDNCVSYIGYPNEGGQVGSWFQFSEAIAMSSRCADKDGAWTFLRTLLLPHEDIGSPNNYGLPINREDFQRMIDLSMQPNLYKDNPTKYIILQNEDNEIAYEGRAITEEEKMQLLSLYNQIEGLLGYDNSIFNIITEQAGAYFVGDKSLNDVVTAIENRVNLYLAELS